MRHKTLSVSIKSAGEPSAEQLAAIRAYTLADVPAEKLYVRTFALAHNGIDRDNEAFDEAVLADFARTLPGKGLFIKHPTGWDGDTGPGKGRWFAARVERMSLEEARVLMRTPDLQFPPGTTTAVVLMADAYLPRTAGNTDLLEEIDAGVVSDVSVGFTHGKCEPITDEDGRELTARRLLSPREALEGSLVWLGAQPGARAIKNAPRTEEPDMHVDQKTHDAVVTAKDAAEAKVKELQQQLSEAGPSREIVINLRKALGDRGSLVEDTDGLAALVLAGDAHRKALVADIIAGERALGLVADDEEAVKAAEAIHNGESLERLQALAKHYGERVPKGSRMPSGDPSARGGVEESPAGLDGNPALA